MKVNFILCYITCASENEAKKIALELVTNKIAACCNYFPLTASIYEWQGQIQEDKEVILLVKTIKENYKKLESKVQELHSYECPCIIALNIEEINSSYASWLLTSCQVQES